LFVFKVDFDNVRGKQEGAVNALLEAEKQAEATKQAIKRIIAQAADAHVQSRDLPAKLRINPEDPEDVVNGSSFWNYSPTCVLISCLTLAVTCFTFL